VYWARIDNLHVTSIISSDHSLVDLDIEVNLASSAPPSCTVQVEILNDKEHVISKATLYIRDAITGKTNIHLQNPKLWWPYGQGEQSLYKARATLQTNERVTLDISTTQFGIRSITVIQRPLDNEPGKTFMFNVNGRDIFIQGGDWIPADNLLPRIKREKYFGWMELAQKSNLNMIRVWGGGIYEPEDFWDACDQAGMLVWHDYAFACGDYPTHKAFLDSVRREAEVQTTRFRNRASLAVLCGGNEDFMLADWVDE
jgi:beta-mannosidase